MTANEYLGQIKTARMEVEYCKQKINDLRDMSLRISDCTFDAQNNPNHSIDPRFVKYLGEIEEMELELSRKIETYMALEIEITQTIMRLPDPLERRVLELIYLNGLTTAETAKYMNFSAASVKRRKSDAFISLEKLIPCDTK